MATILLFACATSTGSGGKHSATSTRDYFTQYGVLTLRFDGAHVVGTYPHETGSIVGTLTDNELQGQWRQGDGGGTIIVTFAPGMETFKARYNHVETPEKWLTDWSGMLRPEQRTRMYRTTWGTLTCNFEGLQVACSYPWYNGRLLGELNGYAFKGIWLQSNRGIGNLNLQFDDDFAAFTGKYNDWNHHQDTWHDWKGTLISKSSTEASPQLP